MRRPIRSWDDVASIRPDGRLAVHDPVAFKALIGLETRYALIEQAAQRAVKSLDPRARAAWVETQLAIADDYVRSLAEALGLTEDEALRRWGVRPRLTAGHPHA